MIPLELMVQSSIVNQSFDILATDLDKEAIEQIMSHYRKYINMHLGISPDYKTAMLNDLALKDYSVYTYDRYYNLRQQIDYVGVN